MSAPTHFLPWSHHSEGRAALPPPGGPDYHCHQLGLNTGLSINPNLYQVLFMDGHQAPGLFGASPAEGAHRLGSSSGRLYSLRFLMLESEFFMGHTGINSEDMHKSVTSQTEQETGSEITLLLAPKGKGTPQYRRGCSRRCSGTAGPHAAHGQLPPSALLWEGRAAASLAAWLTFHSTTLHLRCF